MKRDLWLQAGQTGWRVLAPFLLAVTVMAMAYLPSPEFILAMCGPAVALAYVYHQGVHQPALLPYPLAFLAGLLADFWAGGPVGANALLCFLLAALVVPQERFFRSVTFPTIWAIFALLCLGWLVAQWLYLSLYYWRPLAPWALIGQAVLAFLLFAPLSRLFAVFNAWVAGEPS
ncbi:MAG: hypothetical protein Tsb0016_15950 [Sphingomonadales bacterium]